MKLIETKDGVVLEILVKPKSGGFKILVDDGDVVVFCREEPVKGKVNKELIKEFSKLFHRTIELVSGFSSRQKKLLIRDVEKGEVENVLLGK